MFAEFRSTSRVLCNCLELNPSTSLSIQNRGSANDSTEMVTSPSFFFSPMLWIVMVEFILLLFSSGFYALQIIFKDFLIAASLFS